MWLEHSGGRWRRRRMAPGVSADLRRARGAVTVSSGRDRVAAESGGAGQRGRRGGNGGDAAGAGTAKWVVALSARFRRRSYPARAAAPPLAPTPAVQCQQEDCARILLDHGADPNVSDIYGNTALHYAACGECVTTVAQLLSHNADIEANNKEGFTPLLLAIRQGKHEMTKYLLTKGANVHAVDKKKRTTLMLAIDNGSTVIARLLLRQDIDVLSEDTLGWTAKNYARKRGLNTIWQLIDMYKVDKGIKNSSQNNRNSSPGSDSPGITVSDVSSQTPGNLKTEGSDEKYHIEPATEAKDSVGYKRVAEKATQTSGAGSDSPSITVSDASSQTSGDLKTEEQDFIMMSKKEEERPDGSDHNHPQLSKAEGKVSSLEIELSHTRDALREKTLDLESVERDLSHIRCQKKNIEHKYENKQDKLNKYIRKQEFLEKRLSQLQSENELLRQQLDTAQNKAKNELQTEREKCLTLEGRNKELLDDFNHLKERMNQGENEKRELEVLVRHQLQQEWADMEIQRIESESLLEATSYYTIERQDLKKKLNQALSQVVDLSRKLEVSSSEVRNLKTHLARISLEHNKLEQYRRDTEERARQKTGEKLKEVDWFLQDEAQKRLQQWREKDNSSFRMQMELRIKDLEFQLSKKTSQDSITAELEKYKQLHREEVNTSLSLANQLDKTTERLAEINSKRREKEMDTFFAKMEQEFDKNITRALKEDAAKFEFESSIAAPLGSMDGLTPTQALLLKTSQEYAQILRKNYMI
ncbi:ankyrin repeat domain-containing protein 62-like [Manis pentadactyla]|uniref:ankyrin repeat domain-containing protein 62-like n=1 Tax=Manis pentadactyla TaxID=143292 RepID=UPI00255CF722|nr:ankyrin repeat domain-containing protein 62-like [Manis pentadactyla]